MMMMSSTMLLIAALQLALYFCVTFPVIMLVNCSKKKTGGSNSMKSNNKKKTAPSKPVSNSTLTGGTPTPSEEDNQYISKTTNKVDGIGNDDPDLDSSRLQLMRATH